MCFCVCHGSRTARPSLLPKRRSPRFRSRASFFLQDLDADALLCVARHTHPGDWLCLALQCRDAREACRCAHAERHRRVHGEDPARVEWRTLATASEARLAWAVACMGYRPAEGALRAIAFRGDLGMYDSVRRRWGLRETNDTYRYAGASGHLPTIRAILRRMNSNCMLPHHHNEAVYELLYGMAAFDRVQALSVMWHLAAYEHRTLALAHACVTTGAEAALALVLERAPACVLHGARMERLAKGAASDGRAPLLRLLVPHLRRLWPGERGERACAALVHEVFADVPDAAEQAWRLKWDEPEDFRPVDHVQVLRHLADDLGFDVPRTVVSQAIRHGSREALELLHRTRFPVHTWQDEHWVQALTCRPDPSLADWLLLLGGPPRLEGNVLALVTRKLLAVEGNEARLLAVLDWLLARGVPWSGECTRVAASRGSVDVLLWMRGRGAPVDPATILEDAMDVFLQPSPPNAIGRITPGLPPVDARRTPAGAAHSGTAGRTVRTLPREEVCANKRAFFLRTRFAHVGRRVRHISGRCARRARARNRARKRTAIAHANFQWPPIAATQTR